MTDSHDDRTVQVPVSLPTRANHGFDFDEADTAHLADVERALLIKDVEFWIRQADKFAAQIAAIERVADMAQDDEDGNGWVPVGPLLDALYPEKRGVSDD